MYSLDMLERLCTAESALVKLQLDTCRRRQRAEEELQRTQRTQQMKQALAATAARVEAKKRMVERRALLVEAASGVAEAYARREEPLPAAVGAASKDLVAARRRVRQARIIVEDLRAMLARERAVCAAALQSLFPMEPGDTGWWTICGESLFAADEISTRAASEQTAMALGLVASAVDAAAKYLSAPVRFPVVVRGARSAVVNPTTQTLLPLFLARAADRPRLRTAQRMLAVDVVQLLARLGIDDVDSHTIVANLAQLLMAIEGASFA
ncbi:hypothetical protein EV175_005117 [Coemansia sp. RSA 1933]|nr:hypothetical protein EV175_005117 [Coemansia sp. RSA 1933]